MASTTTSTTMGNANVNRTAAMIFGAVFALIGVLGFVPGVTTDEGENQMLLGIFEVTTIHNVVHLLSGLVLLAVAFIDDGRNARITLLVLGAVYALVTIVGFVSEDALESLGIGTNMADNVLHLVLAAGLLAVPLLFRETGRTMTRTGTRV